MGAVGGASLGLALKDWRRAFISGVAGAIGFGAGSYLNILFSVLGGSLGVSLGLALNDWKRAGLLVLAGMIGFIIAILNTWNLSSGEALWSAIMLAVWGVVGGAGLGAVLGYLEKKKADRQSLEA